MFELMIGISAEVCSHLENQARQYKNEVYELDSIIASVQSLRGVGDFGRSLRKIQENMNTQSESLKCMGDALSKIIMNYIRSENRIIDECENGTMKYFWRETGVINIAAAGIPYIK